MPHKLKNTPKKVKSTKLLKHIEKQQVRLPLSFRLQTSRKLLKSSRKYRKSRSILSTVKSKLIYRLYKRYPCSTLNIYRNTNIMLPSQNQLLNNLSPNEETKDPNNPLDNETFQKPFTV